MGWVCEEDRGVHKGYVVGLVEDQVEFIYKGGSGSFSGGGATYLRELTYETDHDREVPKDGLAVPAFQVGCDCGWRSRRFAAPPGARWYPHRLDLGDDALEAAAREEWLRHVQDELERDTGQRHPTPIPFRR
jgi:hypothetical protein